MAVTVGGRAGRAEEEEDEERERAIIKTSVAAHTRRTEGGKRERGGNSVAHWPRTNERRERGRREEGGKRGLEKQAEWPPLIFSLSPSLVGRTANKTESQASHSLSSPFERRFIKGLVGCRHPSSLPTWLTCPARSAAPVHL